MFSKTIIVATFVALAHARFGQEGLVQAQVQALSDFGEPGAAGTLAGQTPGVLLAGANACDKLALADDIVDQLGDDDAVIEAAKSLVQAEKNFNPSAQDIPTICSDASLPATEALRGIVPLVDPSVDGADVENDNAAASLDTPFDAEGKSVADIMAEQGFDNFDTQAAA